MNPIDTLVDVQNNIENSVDILIDCKVFMETTYKITIQLGYSVFCNRMAETFDNFN